MSKVLQELKNSNIELEFFVQEQKALFTYPSRIPSAFFRVLHSKSRILWCIRSFGLGIFRLREVKKRSHTGVCLRFFAHYQRKITSQNRLLPNKHRRTVCCSVKKRKDLKMKKIQRVGACNRFYHRLQLYYKCKI